MVLRSQLKLPESWVRTELRGRVKRRECGGKRQSDGSRCLLLPCQPPPLALCPCRGFSPWKPRNAPQLPINCLCPHLLGDASGRLGRRENLFPDPIQRRGLPVRDLHSHRRHRLQGEVAAGSASRSEQDCGSGPGTALPSPVPELQDGGSLPGGHKGYPRDGTTAVDPCAEAGLAPCPLQEMNIERLSLKVRPPVGQTQPLARCPLAGLSWGSERHHHTRWRSWAGQVGREQPARVPPLTFRVLLDKPASGH